MATPATSTAITQPPATLPADFTGWDAPQKSTNPPKTLPADFNGWDAPHAATHTTIPNFAAAPGNKEGTYKMQGPNGVVGVPYSNVIKAKQSGYNLDPSDSDRYQRDFAADPNPGPRFSAYTPSLFESARNSVANSPVGYALEQGMPKVADALHLHPTETVNSPTYQAHRESVLPALSYLVPSAPQNDAPDSLPVRAQHFATGVANGINKLASAKNVAIGTGIAAGGELLAPLAGGTGLLGAAGRSIPIAMKLGGTVMGAKGVYDSGKQALKQFGAGDTNDALESVGEGVPNAGLTLLGLGKPLEAIGDASQRAGEGLINQTVGAKKGSFARGASPGAGYFQAGFGPSASIGSIANKSGVALDSTGAAIGSGVRNFENGGGLIPYENGARPIQQGIDETRASLLGPGGTGTAASLDNYANTWNPLLQSAQERGGFLPTEYAAAKRNTATNTTWGDPAQAGMKDLRQLTVGGMGGQLVNAVPELAPLNSKYQNLLKLNNIASERFNTGSTPLSAMKTRAILSAVLGAGGAESHGLLGAGVGILGGSLLDSVLAKTSLASGMFYGGKALSKLGFGLSGMLGPSVTEPDDEIVGNSHSNPQNSQFNNPQGGPLSSPYRMQGLTPEIIRPDALSRSKIGIGADGRGGILQRPLGLLGAPDAPAPQATPYLFNSKMLFAVPATTPEKLGSSIGSRASLLPNSLLGDVTSQGTLAEQAAALRRAQLGSYGNVLPLRLLGEPETSGPSDLTSTDTVRRLRDGVAKF